MTAAPATRTALPIFAAGVLLAVAAFAVAASTEPEVEAGTTVIEGHQVIREDTAFHDILVRSGAVLEIQGAEVRVGDRVLVEPGGTLRLGPGEGAPAQLLSGDDNGFWLQVEGRVESAGEPRSIIDGLAGEGLDSVLLTPGGVRINGTGDLKDIIIRNGTAGVIVGPDAELWLRDAELSDLYLMGLATRGNTTVERTVFSDNIISLTGKGTCSVVVRDSTFLSMGAHFQMNSCPLTGSNLDMRGGSNAIVLNGAMELRLEDVHLYDYGFTGIRGDGGSTMLLRNVTMDGGGRAMDGIRVKPAHEITLDEVRSVGHKRHGLDMQSSVLEVKNSAFLRNGEHGMRLVDTEVVGGTSTLMALDFGTGTEDANGKDAVDLRPLMKAYVLDHDAIAAGLELEIRDDQGEVVYESSGPSSSSLLVHFPIMRETAEGLEMRGPFHYLAKHPAWEAPQEGVVDPTEGALVFEIAAEEEAAEPPAGVSAFRMAWVAAGLGAALVLVAVLGPPVRRRLRTRKGPVDPAGDEA